MSDAATRGSAIAIGAGLALLAAGGAALGTALPGPRPAASPSPAPAGPRPAQSAPRSGAAPRPSPAEPQAIHLAPQARAGSSYALDVRFEVATKDVTFDAPPAYKDSFGFWTSRMKGNKKSELYQLLTLTDDAAADGTVPYRKQISRVQVDVEKQGSELMTPDKSLDVLRGMAWAGTMDRFGNVTTSRKVAGKDDTLLSDLSMPYAEAIFPRLDGSKDLKVGESVASVQSLPLPSRLHIEGLDEIGVLVTRDLVLKQVSGDRASFDVRLTFANDPRAGSSRPDTLCTVSGSGQGEAIFDLRHGVFLSARQPATMILDIQAPLRPLPEHPETEHPGIGRSHLELELLTTGQQAVHKIMGDDD